jgi:hypothetical protein
MYNIQQRGFGEVIFFSSFVGYYGSEFLNTQEIDVQFCTKSLNQLLFCGESDIGGE